jgi:CubicO group peptidase (beta-lactamase class C family)
MGAIAQQAPVACGTPNALADGWALDTPEHVGLDITRLCGIAERLKGSDANVHAMVIVRHGKLVFEQYYPGDDYPWGHPDRRYEFDAATKHDMRSVSKSVTSLLIGIAIDSRLITSVEEPVVKFFPEYAALATPGWDRVTLRNLLTMSSGIEWDEARPWNDPKNDEPYLGSEPDPLRYVLAKPIVAPADLIWNYNGGGTDLLGAVIARVSGKAFEVFADEALFQPLGITDWEWRTTRNTRFSPPPACGCALAMLPRSANSSWRTGHGMENRSSRRSGLRKRPRRAFKPSACSSTATNGGLAARSSTAAT